MRLAEVLGLLCNTTASVILIYPYLKSTKKLNDNEIMCMDEKGNHATRRSLEEKFFNRLGLLFLFGGFSLQLFSALCE